MSSDFDDLYLTSDEVNLIVAVLSRDGIASRLHSRSKEAAEFLHDLIQDGILSPEELSAHLVTRLHFVSDDASARHPRIPRYAIQGLAPKEADPLPIRGIDPVSTNSAGGS